MRSPISKQWLARQIERLRRRYTSILLAAACYGCNSEVIAVKHPEQSFLWLSMNTNAAVLSVHAPYKTIQLSATAYQGNGEIIPEVTPEFVASNETIVVSESGLVTAVSTTTEDTYVLARATINGVTRTDTTWITVLDETPLSQITSFILRLDPNTPVVAGQNAQLLVTVLNANGDDISTNIPVHFTSSDESIASINRHGVLSALVVEQSVVVKATTTIYGVTLIDSLKLDIEYPMYAEILTYPRQSMSGTQTLSFNPTTVTIRAGGTVNFCNCQEGAVLNSIPVDIIFEQPEAAQPGTGSGNILNLLALPDNPIAAIALRTFPVPGTYVFKGEPYGSTATIIVR